jgi:hypothetical protein
LAEGIREKRERFGFKRIRRTLVGVFILEVMFRILGFWKNLDFI